MNVGQLISALSKLPAGMPVVVAQEDEPLGNYGVAAVSAVQMQRDDSWGHRDVWDPAYGTEKTEVVTVAFLETDEPPRQVIDVELPAEVAAAPALEHAGPAGSYTYTEMWPATTPPGATGRSLFCILCGHDVYGGLLCDSCTRIVEQPPAEVAAPSAGELEVIRLAPNDVEAAELRTLGWHEVGTNPDGGVLFARPVPVTTSEVEIPLWWAADSSYVVRGSIGDQSAVIDNATRCADCGQPPAAGQKWTATLAATPADATWRHTLSDCPA